MGILNEEMEGDEGRDDGGDGVIKREMEGRPDERVLKGQMMRGGVRLYLHGPTSVTFKKNCLYGFF